MAKVIAYIDGFNLYYRALRKPEHKWLDVARLIRALLPDDEILAIKYFTAKIQPSKIDPQKNIRQQVYLRALHALKNVQVIYGNYVTDKANMPLHEEWTSGIKKLVTVAKTEEKGSDVNLAAHLVWDGCQNKYEVAAVLSADSDLSEPLRIVAEEMHKPIILLHPYIASSSGTLREPTRKLRRHAIGIKKIREGLLGDCQLPSSIKDADGEITRPQEWGVR